MVAVHATVSPEAARQTAAIIESQGARYLDAPFTGSKVAAGNGQLVYYIGGSEQALAEARPALEASSKKILYVGGIGDASVLKIATNMLTATTVQTLAEALALVRSAGIDASKFAEAMENNASRSGTSDLKLPAMLAQNFEPNFSLKHMLKDIRLAAGLAAQGNVALPLTSAAEAVLSASVEKGWGDEDFAVLARNYPLPAPALIAAPDSEAASASASPTEPAAPPILDTNVAAESVHSGAPVDESARMTASEPAATGWKLPSGLPDLHRAKKNTMRFIRELLKLEPAGRE